MLMAAGCPLVWPGAFGCAFGCPSGLGFPSGAEETGKPCKPEAEPPSGAGPALPIRLAPLPAGCRLMFRGAICSEGETVAGVGAAGWLLAATLDCGGTGAPAAAAAA